MNKIEKVLLVLVFFVFVIPLFILVAIRIQDSNKEPEQVFCTMEAKMCPDGSYVGRSGPKCEFAECPKTDIKETDTAKINQKILNNGIFITPLKIISDSRCPSDVQCIWAGTIVIRLRLERDGMVQEVDLEIDKTIVFSQQNVSLKSAAPYPKEGKEISENEYIFSFIVN